MNVQKSSRVIWITAILLSILFLITSIIDRVASQPQAASIPSAAAIPPDPPVADKISFSFLNDLGEATVTGAPGAVLPSAHVLLINLDSSHQDYVIAAPDGSFSAKIFAPPGSSIMIKHGPDHKFWTNTAQGAVEPGYSIFPSTTIYRPHGHDGGPNGLPFAAAGAIDIVDTLPSSIGAGWSLTGTVHPVNDLHPGDTITVETTIRLYSQAINAMTDVSTITLQMSDWQPWLMLFDEVGNPVPYMNQAGSKRLTPSGLPILEANRPDAMSQFTRQPIDWQYKGGQFIEGKLLINITLNETMPSGIYRPIFSFDITGVPSGNGWRAALLSWLAGWPSYKFNSSGIALPPLEVKAAAETDTKADYDQNPRLIWYLQMDKASLGTRGTGAVQDKGVFQPASFVVTQGAPFILPPVDPLTGAPAVYRLEPYLPLIGYGRGAAPTPPLLPFDLPGGQLCVTVHEPDGQPSDIGCQPFAQSVSGDRSTADGELLNFGAIEVSEYYGLTTTDERFAVSFAKPGLHLIEMTGWVEDVWGNRYEGGGTYEVWVAHPIDIDPGLLPGTPLAIGDAVNPTVQLQPRVPAYINLTIEHFPYSDPNQMEIYTVDGYANRFGYFAPDKPPIMLNQPGEYRLHLLAQYTEPETGEMYMAAATWGGVVMTPPDEAQLVAHGRRGSDNITGIPNQWFLFCDKNLDPPLIVGGTPHLWNPYLNGDILWTYDSFVADNPDCLGEALMMNASVHDTVGSVEAAITERHNRTGHPVAPPGSFEQRVQVDALPLFSSTRSGRPVSLVPEETDQIAYAYLSSQRPGVRVREAVAEDNQGSGYWRVFSMYDNQPGVGVEGDLPHDFKFQYVGVVYRDLESGLSEYLGQGSGWIHLPYEDMVGSRVMPPFSGPGNGGWPTAGGPLMTLKGEAIDMFIMPTGVRPGAVLQVGDRFDFAGHLMPTLDSRVDVEVTSPSGRSYLVSGRANPVGYFYNPQDSFIVDEPGRWTVQVRVWHDGQIGSGEQVNCDPAEPFDPARPCPSGDVLGSMDGRYSFYAVAPQTPRLLLTEPAPGRLTFGEEVTPITISGLVPEGVSQAAVEYTLTMPGFILAEGQAQVADGRFSFIFDPAGLQADFPNLDLTGRHGWRAGLADTFSFGLLLNGEQNGEIVYYATTLTIQGDQVYVESGEDVPLPPSYLPAVLVGD